MSPTISEILLLVSSFDAAGLNWRFLAFVFHDFIKGFIHEHAYKFCSWSDLHMFLGDSHWWSFLGAPTFDEMSLSAHESCFNPSFPIVLFVGFEVHPYSHSFVE